VPPAPVPANESDRLATLRACSLLDTAFDDAFGDLTQLAARLTDSPMAMISLVEEKEQIFKYRVGVEADRTSRDISFCAHAILEPDRTMVVPDTTQDGRFADNPLVTGEAGIRFYAGAPLVTLEGHAIGTLCIADRQPRELGQAQVEMLASLAKAVSKTIALHRAARQVRGLALTDALTGLANRVAFMDALERAMARQRRDGLPFALLYLDLDGFKGVNDRFGHAAGDEVLRATASVLKAALRREDLAARMGGDEFACLLVGGDQPDTAATGERVRAALVQRMAVLGRAISASVGAVTFRRPPEDAAAALARVDAVMYAAKAAGKDRVIDAEV